MRKFSLLATFLLLASAVVVEAHHPFAENFNSDAPVTMKGVVTRIDWTTPHTWIYVNVNVNGSVQRWAFQVASNTVLMERGWNRDDVKVGDEVTVDGFEANEVLQNRIYTGNARAITFPNGKRVLSGSPGDGGPPPRPSS